MRWPVSPSKLTRFCWQSLAVTLVLFALVVSLIRGLLPQLDQVRQQVVDYFKDQYHIQVTVGQLDAQWQAFGPALTIDNLVLPPQENLPVTVIIDKVNVKLDFWETILTATPQVEDVIFDGVRIALNVDSLVPTNTGEAGGDTNMDWLYSLLLEQLARFSITDVAVQLLSQQRDYPPIHVKNLRWRNADGRHLGQGVLHLDDDSSQVESLSVSFDLLGNGYRADSIRGQIYVAAQSLDLGEWASRQPNPYDLNAKLPLEGVVNLQAWIQVANRNIESGLVLFQPSWLEWELNDQAQKFEITGGTVEWYPTEEGWQLTSDGLDFVTNGQHWPELKLLVSKKQDDLFASVNQLAPQTFLPLLPLVPSIELSTLLTWQALAPHGAIGPLQISQQGSGTIQAQVKLSRLTWQAANGIPGVSPVDLQLTWFNNQLHYLLPEQDYNIDFAGMFREPLVLHGDVITGKFSPQALALDVTKVQLHNDDLSLDARMRLSFADAPHLALAANVNIFNAANAGRYFPRQAMGESLADYLEQAIEAGQSHDAKVVWHGALSQFPYEHSDGVFQAAFSLTEAKYAFQPDWPAVTELSLQALFENARMDLWVDKGNLLKVPADGAHVYIPAMGLQTMLKVQAALETTGPDATQVLQASPLADSVGKTLEVVQVQGGVKGDLDLTLPFYQGAHQDIRGRILFDKTPVYITEPGVLLNRVSGEVNFINQHVEGKNVQARLFGQPINLSFDTQQTSLGMGLNASLTGRWDLTKLPDDFINPLSPFYDGKVTWKGMLKMIFEPSGYSIQANVVSDLLGTSLTLPGEFAKAYDEPRDFVIELVGDNKQSSLGARLGEQLEFWGTFDETSGKQLNSFDLLIGRVFQPGDELVKQQGHIRIDLTDTQFTQWMPIIDGFISLSVSRDESRLSVFPAVVAIDASIDHINILGQSLHHFALSAKPDVDAWRFKANADEFVGQVDFYPNWLEQGIKVVGQKLYLSPQINAVDDTEVDQAALMGSLPPIAVEIDDFQFYDKPLGRLVLQGTPSSSGYQIQTLSLNSPDASIEASGAWHNQDGQNLTTLDVSVNAANFEKLSQRLGISPGLNDARLDLTANIQWNNTPYLFDLNSLNGTVRFDFGKGYLAEISDNGARIFSLFSLDSLLRKLSLDFSDVFGKGLYFDAFSGDLVLDNGVVKTTNTKMDAHAGNIKVRGYTDLTTESLNYDIRFIPQLASSVPTVVLLSTSAWTLGVGAFALTKVLEPVIEVISEIRFRLTGTMTQPKLDELERKSKEIEIPASVLRGVAANEALPAESGIEAIEPAPEPSAADEQPSSPESIDNALPTEPSIDDLTPIDEVVNPIKSVRHQGAKDANQLVTMSEQSRRRCQFSVYRQAA